MTLTKDKDKKEIICSKKGCNNVIAEHGYCRECRKIYNKQYRKENNNQSYNLYIVIDKCNDILYVGCTENLKQRMSSHINGHSNIEELMLSDKWECIKYLDITNIVENREELYLLENCLIDLYKPKWNDQKNVIRNIDKLREFCLTVEVHSLLQKWKIYAHRKE